MANLATWEKSVAHPKWNNETEVQEAEQISKSLLKYVDTQMGRQTDRQTGSFAGTQRCVPGDKAS